MKIRSFALALALAGAPALLAAQQTPAQGRADHRGGWNQQGGRQGGYLRYRQQLGLTDAQVSRLQSIDQRLQSQNAPLVQRMETARQQAGLPDFRTRRAQRGQDGQGMQGERRGQDGRAQRGERPKLTDEQRTAMRRFREQVKPVQEQLQRNRQAAMRDAQAVLTPQQRQQVQQLMQEHRGARGQRQPRGEGTRQRS
jgi:Spy/CpxP family protein refolding chaperone